MSPSVGELPLLAALTRRSGLECTAVPLAGILVLSLLSSLSRFTALEYNVETQPYSTSSSRKVCRPRSRPRTRCRCKASRAATSAHACSENTSPEIASSENMNSEDTSSENTSSEYTSSENTSSEIQAYEQGLLPFNPYRHSLFAHPPHLHNLGYST